MSTLVPLLIPQCYYTPHVTATADDIDSSESKSYRDKSYPIKNRWPDKHPYTTELSQNRKLYARYCLLFVAYFRSLLIVWYVSFRKLDRSRTTVLELARGNLRSIKKADDYYSFIQFIHSFIYYSFIYVSTWEKHVIREAKSPRTNMSLIYDTDLFKSCAMQRPTNISQPELRNFRTLWFPIAWDIMISLGRVSSIDFID